MSELKHFPLPDVGEGLTEAEVLTWHVAPGDLVTQNQSIVEIETAKASVELPCPYPGRVTELLAEVGQTVQVGTPIITIDLDPDGAEARGPVSAAVAASDGTEPSGSASGESGAASSATAEASATGEAGAESGGDFGGGSRNNGEVANLVGYGPRTTSTRRRPRKTGATGSAGDRPTGTQPADTGSGPVDTGHSPADTGHSPADTGPARDATRVPLAKPPVRKLARELGVDLHAVSASGQGGVITREDVESAASSTAAGEPSAPAQPTAAGQPATTGQPAAMAERERRVPIRGVRKATAQAMVESAFTAPHVTEFLTVDVTPMMELRKRLAARSDFADVKVTPLAFAAKAVCLALRNTPDANATWDEQAGEIVYKDYVHLGVAAATPRGLVVPKVRDAERMSLHELAAALESLTTTARDGKTPPEDMRDGTITISNVGVFGVDTGTPILNLGESAILALGAVREMPWVVDGQVVPRQVCQLALSFDHRVVDGQQGSRFLADIGALLSDPAIAVTY